MPTCGISLAKARQIGVLTVSAMALAVQTGCYTYQPVQSTPPAVQSRGGVVLTDQGRLLLGERLGANVTRVEGVIVSVDSARIVLDVTGTRDLLGGSALWSGERIEVPAVAVMGYQTRVLSKPRSVLLGGAVAAALIVLTFGVSLDLFGDSEENLEVAPPQNPVNPSFRGRGTVPLL